MFKNSKLSTRGYFPHGNLKVCNLMQVVVMLYICSLLCVVHYGSPCCPLKAVEFSSKYISKFQLVIALKLSRIESA